jgi:general secretion pathway protein H
MPTSSTERRSAGFTLLELLVVVVLIGLTTTLVLLNIAPDDRDLVRREADRLAQLVEQARDEAIGTGASLALQAGPGGYRFLRRDIERRWQVVAEAPFTPQQFPPGVSITRIETNAHTASPAEPIVFSPLGTFPALRVHMAAGDVHLRVRADTPAIVRVDRE